MANNIPQGYKQTELGIVPEDWDVKILGNIGTFSKGSGVSRTESNTGKIPCVRYGELYTHHNDYIKTFNSFISSEVAKNAKMIKCGDVLFAASGETKEDIGKSVAFVSDFEAFAGGDIIILSTNGILCDAKYIGYASNSLHVVKQKAAKAQGDAVVHITSDSIKNIKILLPPLSEQKAIAEALSDVDELITALDKKIAKKCLIKQGAMQELLTGKKRLPGFTEEWVEKKLGNIGYTYSGLTGKTKNDFGQGNAKYITFLNVLTNPILKDDLFESVVVNDNEHQNEVQYGDLFFNTSSETPEDVGTCAVILSRQENLYLNSFCFGYRLVDDNVLGLYLAYYFRSNCGRQLMTSLAQGATRYNLSKDLFNSSYITIPKSKDEQQAIATILSDMDKEIADLEAQRDKYRLVKSGMMQKLLTGEIRLKKE